MTLPTFFIVGAPKSGTSSLCFYLNQHPDVCFPCVKETRFFSSGYEKGIDYYRDTFFAAWDGEKAIGEADVTYFARPYAARRIRRDVGNARIVIILRNPVDRAYSDYKMMYHRRGPLEQSFLELLVANSEQLLEYQRLQKMHASVEDQETAYDSIQWQAEFLQNGHYVEHIKCFESHFGRDNVKVLFFEDLATDPTKLTHDVHKFLELEAAEVRDTSAKHFYRPPIRATLGRLVGRELADKTIDLIPKWIKRPVAWRSVWRKPAMSEAEKRWLVDYYRPWNDKLIAFLEASRLEPSWVAGWNARESVTGTH